MGLRGKIRPGNQGFYRKICAFAAEFPDVSPRFFKKPKNQHEPANNTNICESLVRATILLKFELWPSCRDWITTRYRAFQLSPPLQRRFKQVLRCCCFTCNWWLLEMYEMSPTTYSNYTSREKHTLNEQEQLHRIWKIFKANSRARLCRGSLRQNCGHCCLNILWQLLPLEFLWNSAMCHLGIGEFLHQIISEKRTDYCVRSLINPSLVLQKLNFFHAHGPKTKKSFNYQKLWWCQTWTFSRRTASDTTFTSWYDLTLALVRR